MIFDFTQSFPKPDSLDEGYQVIDDLWNEIKPLQNIFMSQRLNQTLLLLD